MEESTSTARLRFIGRRLRELRDDQRLTLVTAGRQIERSSSSLSLIENGHQPLRIRDLKHILDQYGLHDQSPLRHDLLELAHQQASTGWWTTYRDLISPADADFASLEAHASTIENFEHGYVPGLLQNREYVEVIMKATRSPERLAQAERWIEYRMARQKILASDLPVRFKAVIDEAALRRTRGNPDIMRAQLRRLLDETERPNVTLQVLPFSSTADPGANESFRNFHLGRPSILSVTLVSHLSGERLLEGATDLAGYQEAFRYLQKVALTEKETQTMISRLLSEI